MTGILHRFDVTVNFLVEAYDQHDAYASIQNKVHSILNDEITYGDIAELTDLGPVNEYPRPTCRIKYGNL